MFELWSQRRISIGAILSMLPFFLNPSSTSDKVLNQECKNNGFQIREQKKKSEALVGCWLLVALTEESSLQRWIVKG